MDKALARRKIKKPAKPPDSLSVEEVREAVRKVSRKRKQEEKGI